MLLFLLIRSFSGDGRPGDAPDAVVVTVVNRTAHSADYIRKVIENREEYVQAHGRGSESEIRLKNVH